MKIAALRPILHNPAPVWRSERGDARLVVLLRQALAPAAFALALGWYLLDPGGVALMAAVTLGGMTAADFAWALLSARSIYARRRLRYTAMQVGDELEEEISLANTHPLMPVLWAEFVDRSSIPGYTVSSVRAADAAGEVRWRARTLCTRRGVFSLGPWELRAGTPFGIFEVRQEYHDRQDVLVYPPIAALPGRALPHSGAVGDHRPLNQPLRAETTASSTVRAFAPGDPLRHIHWRTTARRAEPYVKVFAPEAASNVWLIPDLDPAVHSGQGGESTLEQTIILAASLAALLLQDRLAVGLFAAGEPDTVLLPRRGQGSIWPILRALALLEARGSLSFDLALQRAGALFRGSDLLVAITPSTAPEWVASLRRVSRSGGGGSRAEALIVTVEGAPPGAGVPAAEQYAAFAAAQGVAARVVRSGDLRVMSGTYGAVARWELETFGTGRLVRRNAPRSAEPGGAPWTG